MGCRIMVGNEEGTEREMAVMFDSVTGWAFGPTFSSGEVCEAYMRWLASAGTDPRELTDAAQRRHHDEFREWLKIIRGAIFTNRCEIEIDDEEVAASFGSGVIVHSQLINGAAVVEKIVRLWSGRTLTIGPLFDDGESPLWSTVFAHAEGIIRNRR